MDVDHESERESELQHEDNRDCTEDTLQQREAGDLQKKEAGDLQEGGCLSPDGETSWHKNNWKPTQRRQRTTSTQQNRKGTASRQQKNTSSHQRTMYHKMAKVILQKVQEMEAVTGARVTLKIEPPCDRWKAWVYPSSEDNRSGTVQVEGNKNKRKSVPEEPKQESESMSSVSYQKDCNSDSTDTFHTLPEGSQTPLKDKPSGKTEYMTVLGESLIKVELLEAEETSETAVSAVDEAGSDIVKEEETLSLSPGQVTSGETASEEHKSDDDTGHISPGTGSFTCDFCKKVFSHRCNLEKHVSVVHLGVRPFGCEDCEKRFGSGKALKKHIRAVHLQERPHDCQSCGKKFKTKAHLETHVSTVHEQKRSYECEFCGKRFGTQGNVKLHISLVHVKERPHTCDICGKTFGHLSTIKNHISNVHKKERPHMCQHCGKRFGQVGNLASHISTVHNKEQPYKCQYCGKKFGHESHLKRHVSAIHMKEQPHVCEYCGNRFSHKSTLTQHVKNIHMRQRDQECQM